MKQNDILLKDEAATKALAGDFAKALKPGELIFLSGDLGSGKTFFTRALLQALGHSGHVKSPTYTLVESYALNGFALHHFDLYRLEAGELSALGLEDYLDGKAVAVIEWPEKAQGGLPQPTYHLHFFDEGGSARRVSIEKL